MKYNPKWLLVGALIYLAGMFVFTILKDWPRLTGQNKTTVNGEVSPTQPAPAKRDYSSWKLFRNGYALSLPPGWKNTSDTGGRAILQPGEGPESKIGGIYEISVTVLSDTKAPQGQRFTTQREFDDWQKVEGDVQGTIQKLDNITIDGVEAIELLDVSGGENEWSVIAWARKDNINLYITFKGNQKYTREDAAAIDHIVSSFTFKAPPMTGTEGK